MTPEERKAREIMSPLLDPPRRTRADPWLTASPKSAEEYVQDIAQAIREVVAEERERKDAAYLERNHVVAALARLFPSGTLQTDIPGWSPEWHGCVYIELPSGQISYHYHDSHAHLFDDLPAYSGVWDGHNKDVVHERLAKLTAIRNATNDS